MVSEEFQKKEGDREKGRENHIECNEESMNKRAIK